MVNSGKRWTVQDKYGNKIYLTQERWEHIVDDTNHPEMMDYEEHLKITIKQGRRRQEPHNSRKYRYYQEFDDLPDGANHIIAIILCKFTVNGHSQTTSNNYIATAFLQYIRRKR